jgi:predicted NAD-dependent protein-ADP-ribosyltransferase YbiA (DUF1768 family)
MNQEPSFEEILYEAMKFVHPALTTRLFSVACLDRCQSYWSSVVSQGLKVPNTALLSLYDYLEAKKIVQSHEPSKVKVINGIQEMIEVEILHRFKETNQISKEGWDRLAESIREEVNEEKYGYYDSMPFISTKYSR